MFFVFVQPSAGPSKKSKPTSAAGGKPKKTPDSKEVTESELSVSLCAYICFIDAYSSHPNPIFGGRGGEEDMLHQNSVFS